MVRQQLGSLSGNWAEAETSRGKCKQQGSTGEGKPWKATKRHSFSHKVKGIVSRTDPNLTDHKVFAH